jgi:hypothetical protein
VKVIHGKRIAIPAKIEFDPGKIFSKRLKSAITHPERDLVSFCQSQGTSCMIAMLVSHDNGRQIGRFATGPIEPPRHFAYPETAIHHNGRGCQSIFSRHQQGITLAATPQTCKPQTGSSLKKVLAQLLI